MSANPEDGQRSERVPVVSVIVPARNEEECLGACLASLECQAGIPFEVIVVNDQSSDRTGAIAEQSGIAHVIDAGDLPSGWTGKNHAVHCGAQIAKGKWLLFTDADTVHRHGSLRRAVEEAENHDVDLLSYSPKQEVVGFWQRALMPIVFAELRRQYPPNLVSSPDSNVAAANGQYLLIRRDAYDAVGGHAAVKDKLLEDVELAKLIKQTGRPMRFRYGRDAVETRMYRSFGAMWEGWTKNLAVLFPLPIRLAALRTLELLLVITGLVTFWQGVTRNSTVETAIGLVLGVPIVANFYYRVRRAHFSWTSTLVAPLGLPLFVILLVRSRLHYKRKQVSWKGRTYDPTANASVVPSQREQEPLTTT